MRDHGLVCLLAYYVEWHMRRALAPLLFGDVQPQEQASPVPGATLRLSSGQGTN
ncbi:MAG: hypothetical protein JO138_25480 [Acidobacteriaceae bacterium]|nr:hypothetical protein [Acidobacteriaceae bacterium]